MEKYDVIIVGGGPAGSTAGYYINGLKTLIVDKYDFPRHKACGGGLMSERDWSLEFENYAKIKNKLKAFSCDSIKFYWNKVFIAQRKFKHLLDQVSRYELDDLLLKEALSKGNISFLKFNLKEIKRAKLGDKNGFVVSDGMRQIFCHYLIGADGFNSRVAKFLGNRLLKNHQMGHCLEYDIVCEKKTKDIHVSPGYSLEIGYGWIFPTARGYQLGVGLTRKLRKNLKTYLDSFSRWAVEKQLIPEKYKVEKISGGCLPLKITPKYCTDNTMLCGDAMGLVKVLTGEGIYYAMKSGKIAGQLLSASGENIKKRYKKAVRPLIWDVFITPYIPPKIFTLTFWSIFFYTGKVLDRILGSRSRIWNVFLNFFMRMVMHRNKLGKRSFYYDEDISVNL